MYPVRRVFFMSGAVMLLFCAGLAGAASVLEAGAAKIDITPELGVPLNGYGARLGRGNEGVHDPLWVRSLYLSDGATSIFWVTADLCVINRELRDRVLELAPAGVPRENIILSATHNHSGTGGMVRDLIFRSISGRFVPEALEATAQGFAQSMQEAYDARGRATIGVGTGRQTVLSANRRVSGGPIDEQIGVVRVDDPDGNAIAILANFAAHPTTTPPEDGLQVSADYPGYFYTHLEELSHAGTVAMFTNGALGDQRCANPEDKSGWDHVESIGRLLALRVKEIANGIECGGAELHLASSNPNLPLTLADSFLPAETTLQALEINDALFTFYPGEPCVELGLEQRRRALQRGYRHQFTVGLSNDHLLYFVPREYYPHLYYESTMNVYGPGISDWFYREFDQLMRLGEPAPPQPPAMAQVAETDAGVPIVTIEGDAREAGRRHGEVFREAVDRAYAENIVARVDSGVLVPQTGLWQWLPPFVDPAPLALPRLGIGARPLLTGVADADFDYLEGMAEGAGLAFDALWLIQTAPVFAAQSDIDARYRMPMCTMFAVTGDKAGAAGVLVGRTLDWEDAGDPAVTLLRPETGHAFYSVGFGWNAGVYTGMNAAGLTAVMQRVEAFGDPSIEGAPVEFVLREAMARDETVAQAVQRIEAAPWLRGYSVLLADAAGNAAVVDLDEEQRVRRPENGLLLGADLGDDRLDAATRTRYARADQLLREERILSEADIQAALGDADPQAEPEARIFSAATRHAVVFAPSARRLFAAFPGQDGALGVFEELNFEVDGRE